jgi:hypothetical protein
LTPRGAIGSVTLLALVVLASTSTRVSGQAPTVVSLAGLMHVRAPGFGFIEGPVLDRLKEGRSVPIDLSLAVLAGPDGPVTARAEQRFTVSFDLWEERFAVALMGTARSISHLRAKDAEAWCLERLTIREADMGPAGRDVPFWIRLTYRVPQAVPAAGTEEEGRFTIRGLIDRLSRRREDELGRSMEAGPLRLTN